jgi:hypothetical protein
VKQKPEDGWFESKLQDGGRKALEELCKPGRCGQEELEERFSWLLAYRDISLRCAAGPLFPLEGGPQRQSVEVTLNPHSMDRRSTAHPGFSQRALRGIAKRAAKLRADVVKLRQTPLVGALVKIYELLNRAKETCCVAEGASRGRYKYLRDHPSPSLRLPDEVGGENGVIFRFSAESTPTGEIQ